jgi:8-oxo-dGTP pyrophosphatase MutT (NUDIX family)
VTAEDSGKPWVPPAEAPPIPWKRIEKSLCLAHQSLNPHLISPLTPASSRRAAVAVVLWGDLAGARKVVLVQRGFEAPQHAGEIAFPGGMVETQDRDLPETARRELFEELGIRDGLWEIGCFPDGVAKARTRFTPVFFRWEIPEPGFEIGYEIQEVVLLPLEPLLLAPWTLQTFEREDLVFQVPRLELPRAPLWGATAFVLKAWLDLLKAVQD